MKRIGLLFVALLSLACSPPAPPPQKMGTDYIFPGSTLTIDSIPNAIVSYTLDVDMTQNTGTDLGVVIPGRPGKFFVTRTIQFSVVSVTGTASGTQPAVSGGTVGTTYTDLIGASGVGPTTGAINVGAHYWGSATLAGPAVSAPVIGASTHLVMITKVTGATALTMRYSLQGYWTSS